MFRSSALFTLALACSLMHGCSKAPQGPQLSPVKGKVVYKGEPVPNATVTFIPTKGPAAVGRTNEAGEFELISNGKPGAVEGDHKVTVRAVEGGFSAENVPFDSPEYDKIMSGKMPKEKWLIPEKYGNVDLSGLQQTVTAGKANNLTIDLGS